MISLLLVGKTGCGKSATGNSILRKKVFQSFMSTSSVTKTVQRDFVEFNGKELKVVDCPGLLDTDLSAEESAIMVSNAISQAVSISPDGYDAITFVCEIGRFTEEDVQVISQLKAFFGPDFFGRHCLLAVTHADQYDEEEENGTVLKEWLRQQEGPFAEVRKECCERVVTFDNVTEDPVEQSKQIETLLTYVDQMVAQFGRYTEGLFEKARDARRKCIEDLKEPFISEEVVKDVHIVMDGITEVDLAQDQEALEKLQKFKEEVNKLKDKISQEDKGTGKLSSLLEKCVYSLRLVESKMSTMQYIKEIEKMKAQSEERKKSIAELEKKLSKMYKENEDLKLKMQEKRSSTRDNVEFGFKIATYIADIVSSSLSASTKSIEIHNLRFGK